jgi:hypothetical protein
VPDEISLDGARYFQGTNLNMDCGDGCPLERHTTQRQYLAGSQEDATAVVSGLRQDRLVCPDHGTVWFRRG